MDTKGITKSAISKMGMHVRLSFEKYIFNTMWKHQASDTTILTFEDVRVPVEHIIGEEGMGFTYQMLQFQVSPESDIFERDKK